MDNACVKKIQRLLKVHGFDPGPVDGKWGPRTEGAYRDFFTQGKVDLDELEAQATRKQVRRIGGREWPHQREMIAFYGQPGTNLVRAKFPIAMRIAWAPEKRVRVFTCHQLCKDAFEKIFEEAIRHYGEKEFRRLNLDMYGGCYNKRRIRGGRSWSTHAFGAAMDIWPNRNGMWVRAPKAPLSRPEYEAWWNIVEAQGAVSLGRTIGRDWCHFQFAKL